MPTKAGRIKTIEGVCKGDDYQRPTINQDIFPNTKADVFHRSSSPVAGDSNAAWLVGFGYGSVGYYLKSGKGYVRLVRSNQ